MTRCYEYYVLYLRRPEKCRLSRTGAKYVRRYIKLLRAKGIKFDGSIPDKALFYRLYEKIGPEGRSRGGHKCDPSKLRVASLSGLWRCPSCGYVEIYWKPLYWKVGYHYAHIDDVRLVNPSLAEKLIVEGQAEDDFYRYKLAGRGRVHVHRWPKGLAPRELYEWRHH